MATNRFLSRITIIGVFIAGFVCGCTQEAKPPAAKGEQPQKQAVEAVKPAPKAPEVEGVKIALKPKPSEQSNYRIATSVRRSIKWEGPVPAKGAFDESFNEERTEMAITQRIQGMDANGSIVAQVTINSLKYISIVKNVTSVDFDSSRQSDANTPLSKLIGQNYTIAFEPNNYVTSVTVPALMTTPPLMSGPTVADRAGQNILSSESIKERHSVLILPPKGREQIQTGDKWSKIKTFTFGLMGLKSYEKIYSLKEIRSAGGRQVAVVTMNAIPSSEVEGKFHDQQPSANFPKMFDTNDIYVGSGEVDLTAGCVENYSENLYASWIAALPPNPGQSTDTNEPVVLRMTASRDYKMEKIK
jgi:hypothetical protein